MPRDLFAGTERRVQLVMGTRLTIALAVPRGRNADALFHGAFARARDADALLSNYKPDSPLSRLNRAAGGDLQPVPPALARFLRDCQAYYRRTGRAFDCALGSLITLHRRAAGRAPPTEALAKARGRAGDAQIEVAAGSRARLVRRGARLDPGGIGKGWALDRVAAFLRSRGVRRAFIDFGGSSFYAIGAPHGRAGWPVALRSATPGRLLGIVHLRDASLSSSISFRRRGASAELEHHIIDPRTGRLVRAARFAGVVAPSATDAEVLSTALIVDPALQRRLRQRFPRACAVVQTRGGPVSIPRCLALRRLPE